MQTSFIKKTLLLAMLLVTSSVWADWLIASSSDSNDRYFDPATIVKDGHFRQVEEIVDYKKGSNSRAWSQWAKSEYDCRREQWRNMSLKTYSEPMARGPILIQTGVTEWKGVKPETVGAKVLRIVCGK